MLATGRCDAVAEELAACAVAAREIEAPIMAHVISAADLILLRIMVLSVHSVSSLSGSSGASDNYLSADTSWAGVVHMIAPP
jgi:hypothetical protein